MHSMSEGRVDFGEHATGRGRALKALTLSVEENNRLVEWTRRHRTAQALALRARIVLGCAQGQRTVKSRGACG
jgi:hypothetical protein